jgi:hypothetical protein
MNFGIYSYFYLDFIKSQGFSNLLPLGVHHGEYLYLSINLPDWISPLASISNGSISP